MVRAEVAPEEGARLEALRASCVLDTPREETFDELARLAATLCAVPICEVRPDGGPEERQVFLQLQAGCAGAKRGAGEGEVVAARVDEPTRDAELDELALHAWPPSRGYSPIPADVFAFEIFAR